MITRENIIKEARSWLGVPWKHQGRSRKGIDCAGLIVLVARALELGSYDMKGYRRTPHGGTFVVAFQKAMQQIKISEISSGDVILFSDNNSPCHAAFYSAESNFENNKPTIIHAHALRHKVIEEPFTKEWQQKAIHAFKFYGVSH